MGSKAHYYHTVQCAQLPTTRHAARGHQCNPEASRGRDWPALQRMLVLSNGAPGSFDFAYLEPADLAGYIGGTTPFPPTITRRAQG